MRDGLLILHVLAEEIEATAPRALSLWRVVLLRSQGNQQALRVLDDLLVACVVPLMRCGFLLPPIEY